MSSFCFERIKCLRSGRSRDGNRTDQIEIEFESDGSDGSNQFDCHIFHVLVFMIANMTPPNLLP
jgi:hypothetical protein